MNHPLHAGGAKVTLGAHGYAPLVTVKDGEGNVVFTGPVPFLPVDPVGLTSRGVVKVPDAKPTQLGFQGFFLPTAAFDLGKGPFSTFPAANLPRLLLNAWTGDLGLDDGIPQSVYRLETQDMKQVMDGDFEGAPIFTRGLAVGETMELPDGQGSLTFDGHKEWVVFQVAKDPGRWSRWPARPSRWPVCWPRCSSARAGSGSVQNAIRRGVRLSRLARLPGPTVRNSPRT